jgi:NAD(P)H-dependent flavin oxidoreductase YrpB (nitropropane dioxygenase family)
MTGATVRCIATNEIAAYEEALSRHAPDTEIQDLMRAVRAGRNAEDKSQKRQSAAGQIAGMIRDVPTVAELIDSLLTEAAELAAKLPKIAQGRAGACSDCAEESDQGDTK